MLCQICTYIGTHRRHSAGGAAVAMPRSGSRARAHATPGIKKKDKKKFSVRPHALVAYGLTIYSVRPHALGA